MRLPPNVPALSNEALSKLSEDIRTFVEMITLMKQRNNDSSIREQIKSLLNELKEKKKKFLEEIKNLSSEEEGQLTI